MLPFQYAGCVYLATNRINGRAYIGKALSGLTKRKAGHRHASASGRRTPFSAAIRKHGWDAFEWLELYRSGDEQALLNAEIELIAAFVASGVRLYNITRGGEGMAVPCTESRKAKLREAMTGRLVGEDTRQKLRANALGKRQSEATKAKIADAKRGRKLPPWTEERRAKWAATWAAKRAAGWRPTEAVLRTLAEASRKRALDPEHRARLKRLAKLGAKARWG